MFSIPPSLLSGTLSMPLSAADSVCDRDAPAPDTHHGTGVLVSPAQSMLAWLLDTLILLPEEWDELPERDRDDFHRIQETDELLAKLVRRHLLTQFQADAVRDGSGDDLILGHYRILDVLGQGGMGTVYRAEHLQLRRLVALKVMARAVEANPRLLHRFYGEARAVARLQHPNITACFDAGRAARGRTGAAPRDYFVMEFIAGQDLFNLVRDKGPLSPRRACNIFRQVAEALAEAHRHDLVHRDIKPSNIVITPDWQAKLLDFGLARMPNRNMTEAGTLLGTVGYMAPEQARDPHGVDARADLWSLGATLYWTLTGREPYPESGNPVRDLHRRFTTTPDTVRQIRPEIPAEISELIVRLMETDPDKRYPSARTVATALTGFSLWLPAISNSAGPKPRTATRDRVLVVDDEDSIRRWLALLLKKDFEVGEAADAEAALEDVARHPPDVVIADVNLPDLTGPQLVERIRAALPDPDRVKIILVSGAMPADALGGLAATGADDFLCKPFTSTELLSRVRALLLRRHKDTAGSAPGTVRIPHPAQRVETHSAPRPTAGAEVLSYTVSCLLAETSLVSDGHWSRVIRYVRVLAAAAPEQGEYARLKDSAYLDLLAAVAPIYDMGQLSMPRSMLMKPDKLDSDERSVVQTHTTAGAGVLLTVAGKFAADQPSLTIAAEIARSHHERWDGSGYPDMLAGVDIPLSARVTAIVAVYEALRSRRPHRPPLSHARAVKMITTESEGQYDPLLLQAFVAAAPRFDQIHQGL
jgi:response regulator RpfG family c-di-GMP phosphodiesterase